ILAVTTLVPILQVALSSAEIRGGFTMGEPWITSYYMMIAFFIMRYRIKSIERDRVVAKVEMEKRKLAGLARIFMILSDFTNTPVQSIEFASWLISSGHLEPEKVVEILQNCVSRFRELNAIFRRFENDIDWRKTEEGFDALSELNRLLPK